jgi:hypothetical protein
MFLTVREYISLYTLNASVLTFVFLNIKWNGSFILEEMEKKYR